MAADHYLGYRGMVGNAIRYVAELNGEWLALLGWAAAVLRCEARDRWIGWSDEQRLRRLRFVANNRRFLMLGDRFVPNAASKILATNLRRLSFDWQRRHGHRIVLAETFIDEVRFAGTCYRAAGWLRLGETVGYGRRAGRHFYHGHRRSLWVRPLRRRSRQCLSASFDPPLLVQGGGSNVPDLNALSIDTKDGLLRRLDRLPEVRMRRGKRHALCSVVALAVCSTLMGARSFRGLGQWVGDLSQEVLRRFECPFHDERRRYVAPSEPTLRRMLKQIDVEKADRIVRQWLDEQVHVQRNRALRDYWRNSEERVPLLAALIRGQGAESSPAMDLDSASRGSPD